jgi:hypothetical protein
VLGRCCEGGDKGRKKRGSYKEEVIRKGKVGSYEDKI